MRSRKGIGGAPSKLTPEAAEKITNAVRAGAPLTHACAYAGVHYATVRRWVLRAEQDPAAPPRYREFRDALLRARSELSVGNLATIGKVARGGYVVREIERTYRDEAGRTVTEKETVRAQPNYRAAAWLQERCFPDLFGAGAPPAEGYTVLSADGTGELAAGGLDDDVVVSLTERIAAVRERAAAEAPALEAAAVVDAEVVDDDTG